MTINTLKRKHQSLILTIITLINYSLQGDWRYNGAKEKPFLVVSERLKLNLNTSLKTFSRVNEEESPSKGGHVTICTDEIEVKYNQHNAPIEFETCENSTKIGTSTMSYFCLKGREIGEKPLIKKYLLYFEILKKTQSELKFFYLNPVEKKNDAECSWTTPSYEENFVFLICYSESKQKISIHQLQKNIGDTLENTNSWEFSLNPRQKLDKKQLEIISVKKKTAIEIHLFNFKRSTLDKKFILYSISLKRSEFSKKTFSQKNLDGILAINTNETLKNINRKVYQLPLDIKTDGNHLAIFFKREIISKFTEVFYIDAILYDISQETNNLKEKVSITGLSHEKLKGDFKYLKLGLMNTNFNVNELRTTEGKLFKNSSDAFAVAHMSRSIRSSYILVSKKFSGIVYDRAVIGDWREYNIFTSMRDIDRIEVLNGLILFHGKTFTKEKDSIGMWNFMIIDGKYSYPPSINYRFRGQAYFGIQVFDEYTSSPDYLQEKRKLIWNRNRAYVTNRGKVIFEKTGSPFAKLDVFLKGKNEPGEDSFSLSTFEEDSRIWKVRKIPYIVGRKGGELELENIEGFMFNMRKRGIFVLHLPQIVKGNGVRLDIELEPKNTGIEVSDLKGGKVRISGKINWKYLTLFRVLDTELAIGKLKNSFAVYYCNPSIFSESLDCNIEAVLGFKKEFNIVSAYYYKKARRLQILLKMGEDEYRPCVYRRDSYKKFQNYTIKNFKIVSGMWEENRFVFLGIDKTQSTSEQKPELYFWNQVFIKRPIDGLIHPKKLNLTYKTQGGKNLNYTKIHSLTPVKSNYSRFSSRYFITLSSPDYFSLAEISFDKHKNRTHNKILYTSSLTQEMEKFTLDFSKNQWLTIVDYSSEIKERTLINMRIKTLDKTDKLLEVGKYQIESNFNNVHFGAKFLKIRDLRTYCQIGNKNSCVGFFLGDTRNGKLALGVLNLNPFVDSSNRLVYFVDLGEKKNFDVLTDVMYNSEFDYFLVEMMNSRKPKEFEIHHVMHSRTSFLKFNFTKIENSKSEGDILIKSRVHNFMDQKVLEISNGVIKIHSEMNKMKIKKKKGMKKIIVDFKNVLKKKISLEKQVLDIKGWVYNVSLISNKTLGNENRVIQRAERVEEKLTFDNVLMFFDSLSNYTKLNLFYEDKEFICLSSRNERMQNGGIIALNKLQHRVKDGKMVPFVKFLTLKESVLTRVIKEPNKSAMILLIRKGGYKYFNFTDIGITTLHYDKKKKKFSRILENLRIPGYGYQVNSNMIRLDKETYFFVINKVSLCYGKTDKIFGISFSIKDNQPKSQAYIELKDLEERLNGKINNLQLAQDNKGNIILIASLKYVNRVFFVLLKKPRKGSNILEVKRIQISYFHFSSKDKKVLAEVGLLNSLLRVENDLIDDELTLMLATEVTHSYFLKVKFNNFFKAEKGDLPILKEKVYVSTIFENPGDDIKPSEIKFLGKGKISILFLIKKKEYEKIIVVYDVKEKLKVASPWIMKKYLDAYDFYFDFERIEEDIFMKEIVRRSKVEVMINETKVEVTKLNENFIFEVNSPDKIDQKVDYFEFRSYGGKKVEIKVSEILKQKSSYGIALLFLFILLFCLIFLFAKKNKARRVSLEESLISDGSSGKGELDDSQFTVESGSRSFVSMRNSDRSLEL